MGGVCTGGTLKDTNSNHKGNFGFSGKLRSVKSFNNHNHHHQKKKKNDYDADGNDNFEVNHDLNLPSSYTNDGGDGDDETDISGGDEVFHRKTTSYDSGELFFSISRELKPSTPARVSKTPHVSTFLGKAGSVGLEVLDTLGSSMSNLNSRSGFVSNTALRGNKVSILAFEVANTIVKGSNLMQSLSDESIQILKKEILHSQGVQLLVSTDMKELLRLAASDKREEFEIFSKEVVRFGDMCKDPQWHHLDRFFARLDLDPITNKQLREDAENTMQELADLAQHTSELYHEYHALDRFEQDFRRKLEEVESLHLPRKGESIVILQSELKHQRKLVRNLKKKSLWSKSLEEVVEKLVDVVTFIHQAISEAFEENANISTNNGKDAGKKTERLGGAGLALHYANLITQMDNIASRPTSLPSNMRDTLYNGLPASVKAGLRSRLQALDSKEAMTMPQLKAEMEKTLHWLVPVATDTTKAHQGFGWVGEWANTGNEFGKKTAGSNNIIRLQTLYHADKRKMDLYILDLIILLHRLISLVRYRDNVPKYTPTRSPPTSNGLTLHPKGKAQQVKISPEDKNLLEEVTRRRLMVPGVSKSQEFVMVKKKKRAEVFASSRSMGSSPRRDMKYANNSANMLDVLDGINTTY
ncbi:protein PSK SIMULATOR 2-like [Rutidosis leptorrhynchoides]|uniref:protein PSK SIMULATOR 2-like n=1 Tax=Rutidosis leptorrhynchoides TaxID=125765 RepID=UPI003A9A13AC